MARKGNPNWIRGGQSPNPTGRAATVSHLDARTGGAVNAMAQLAAHMAQRMDGYQNANTGLGVRGKDKTIGACFTPDIIDGYMAENIYRGDPIGARLADMIADDATSEDPELMIGDVDPSETYYKPEAPDAPPVTLQQPGSKPPQAPRADSWLTSWQRRIVQAVGRQRQDASDRKSLTEDIGHHLGRGHLNALGAINQAMKWRDVYGGGAVLIGARDYNTDMRAPLDIKRVRSLDYLVPLEARELLPLYYYNDPFTAPPGKFGEPAMYQLIPFQTGASIDPSIPARVSQIHESRLLVFNGARASRRVLWGAVPGWGDSKYTLVASALQAFAESIQNVRVMLSSFAQAVYKIKGLASALLKNPDALTDAMMGVELCRSICNAVIIDEGEEFNRQSISLAGYPEIVDRLATNISAAAGIPHTRLFGTSAKGLNATGEGDDRNYFGGVSRQQTHVVGPAFLKLVKIEIAARGEDPDDITHSISFKPLWQPTEQEIAQTRKTVADTDKVYWDMGALSPEEIALSRFGGDAWSMETHIDLEARAEEMAVIPPVVESQPPPVPGEEPDPEDGEGVEGDPNEDPNDFADIVAEHADHSDPFAEHTDEWVWVVERGDAFSPTQARGPDGKWIKGGGSSTKTGRAGKGAAGHEASEGKAGKEKTAGKAAGKGAASKAAKPKSATALQKEAGVSSKSKAGQAIKAHVQAGNHDKAQALVEAVKVEKATRAQNKEAAKRAAEFNKAHDEKHGKAQLEAETTKAKAEAEKAKAEAEKAKHQAEKAKAEADIAKAEAAKQRQAAREEQRRKFEELQQKQREQQNQQFQKSAAIADGIAPDGSSISQSSQKALRDEARGVLARYGLTPNPEREGFFSDVVKVGGLKIGYMAMSGRGPLTGTMHSGADGMKDVKKWHDAIKAGENPDPRSNFSRLGTIHEHVHASGPQVPYEGKGMLHEEMVTEMAARHIIAEEHGLSAAGLRAGPTGYSRHMDKVTQHLAEVSGAHFNDAHNALASAALDFKGNKLGSHHPDADLAFHAVAQHALGKLGVSDAGKSAELAKRWADYGENDFKYGG